MARRPAQTMADIPYSLRAIAKKYVDHINRLIRFPPSRGSPLWGERGRLHDKLLRELEKLEIRYGTRAEAEQIAKDIVKRRWRAKKSVGLKARRPPETMADIPFALRKAAKEYIEHVEYMMSPRALSYQGSPAWAREDRKRSKLHNRLEGELRKADIVFRTRDESEWIAQDIVRRRWRAKKSAGRDRLVDRIVTRLALKLVGWKSASLVLTFRNVEPFESLRRHIRDLEWAGARVTGSRMLRGRLDIGEIRVLVGDVATFIRRFKRTRASDYWRERWGT